MLSGKIVSDIIMFLPWYDPVKLDKFGCRYFLSLSENNTHDAQSKQTRRVYRN
jgi:hypothetical protein